MAISPNDDFTAGQVLTATECNQFPRGVMAFNTNTATNAAVTAEAIQITGSSFTAVANRFYRITYYEPNVLSTASTSFVLRIRQTNLTGTLLNAGTTINQNTLLGTGGLCIAVLTFTAGTVNVVGTLQNLAGTGTATRSATQYAFLLVEDIGPA